MEENYEIKVLNEIPWLDEQKWFQFLIQVSWQHYFIHCSKREARQIIWDFYYTYLYVKLEETK